MFVDDTAGVCFRAVNAELWIFSLCWHLLMWSSITCALLLQYVMINVLRSIVYFWVFTCFCSHLEICHIYDGNFSNGITQLVHNPKHSVFHRICSTSTPLYSSQEFHNTSNWERCHCFKVSFTFQEVFYHFKHFWDRYEYLFSLYWPSLQTLFQVSTVFDVMLCSAL